MKPFLLGNCCFLAVLCGQPATKAVESLSCQVDESAANGHRVVQPLVLRTSSQEAGAQNSRVKAK
jgi:hypothetical protein